MKLLELFETFNQSLLEARKNPHLNPRIPSVEELKQLINTSEDPNNLYISFVDIDKIGINPLSTYDTPVGIYCYPIKQAFDYYKVTNSLDRLPFASDKQYIKIIKWNGKGKLLNVESYTFDDLENDIKKIKAMYPNKLFNPMASSEKNLELYIDSAKRTAFQSYNPASQFFNICRWLTLSSIDNQKTITKRKEGDKGYFPEYETITTSESAKRWNTLLRKLGYALILDNGKGIIHDNEPCQAFFTASNFIQRVDTVRNYQTQDTSKIKQHIENNAFGGIVKDLDNIRRGDIIKKYPEIYQMDIHNQNRFVLQKFCYLLNIKLENFSSFYQCLKDDLDSIFMLYSIPNNCPISYSQITADLLYDAMFKDYNSVEDVKMDIKTLLQHNANWKPFFMKYLK